MAAPARYYLAPQPRELDFILSDPKAQLVLFQKRNGEFWLALWMKNGLWDNSRAYGQKQEVEPKERECTFMLNGGLASVTVHEKLDAETPSKRVNPDAKSFPLTLSERVVLLQIAPVAAK